MYYFALYKILWYLITYVIFLLLESKYEAFSYNSNLWKEEKISNDQNIYDPQYALKMPYDNVLLVTGLFRRIDWNIYGKKWKYNLNNLQYVKQIGIMWCI